MEPRRFLAADLPVGAVADHAALVTEVRPDGFLDGHHVLGPTGDGAFDGNSFSPSTRDAAQQTTRDNIGGQPSATISGYVFQDGGPIGVDGRKTPNIPSLRDGVRSPDDTPLAGVVIELRNGFTGEPIYEPDLFGGSLLADKMATAVTDANGYYQFTGLPAGLYGVYQRQYPADNLGGLNTAGTKGGIAIGAWQAAAGSTIEHLKHLPASGDAILQILVGPGEASHENNFSKAATRSALILYTNPVPDTPPASLPSSYQPFASPAAYFIPPPQPLEVPRFLYGGSSMSYSWHLSVMDAGNPRGTLSDVAPLHRTAGDDGALQVKRQEWNQAHWVLVTRDASGRLTERHERRFGAADVIPLTGDFDGDGITDLATFADGEWRLDATSNGQQDATDLWVQLGSRGDLPVTGDWNGDGKTDIGIYGPAWPHDPHAIRHEPGIADAENTHRDQPKNLPPQPDQAAHGTRRLRTAGGRSREDLIDHVFRYGTAGDIPIAGDWNGDGIDTIGIFRDGIWHRDTDGDGRTTPADKIASFGRAGDLPVTGDWNGDGITDLGIYRRGIWYLDSNGNDQLDADDEVVHLGTANDRPITGDFDGDGKDDIGIVTDGRIEWTAGRRGR